MPHLQMMQVQRVMVPFCGGHLPLFTQENGDCKAVGRNKTDTQRWAEMRDEVGPGKVSWDHRHYGSWCLSGSEVLSSWGPSLSTDVGICKINLTLSNLALLGICSLQTKHLWQPVCSVFKKSPTWDLCTWGQPEAHWSVRREAIRWEACPCIPKWLHPYSHSTPIVFTLFWPRKSTLHP